MSYSFEVLAENPLGIPTYVSKLGIIPQDIFPVVFFTFVFVYAILLGLMVVVSIFIYIRAWISPTPEQKGIWLKRAVRWRQMSSDNSLRLVRKLPT